MYRLGKRVHHHRRLWGTLGFFVLIWVGVLLDHRLLHGNHQPISVIHNSPPHQTTYSANPLATMQVDKPLFTLSLPTGWSEVAPPSGGINIPTYRFNSPTSQAEQLNLFVDRTPANLALNRVITVSAKGASLDYNTVSDNCTTFTQPTATEVSAGVAEGKWQGTAFLCDTGNYQRDVVGTASAEGLNVVTLTGPTVGTHKIFMTYSDNNITPDFSVLYNILASFKLK